MFILQFGVLPIPQGTVVEIFLSIVIAVIFVTIVLAIFLVGAHYLNLEKQADQGPSELQSSRDKPEYGDRGDSTTP